LKAVVLGAGEGSRLRPLTSTRPKCMIPIAGKPILEHLLSALKENGIEEVLVIVGYRKEHVKNYFRDGEGFGIGLGYLEQKELLGTADAIGLAEEHIRGEDFLVVYGDLLIDPSVVKAALHEYSDRGLITLTVAPVRDPSQYGVVASEKGLVKKIFEKPKSSSFGNLANVGVYIFSKEAFKAIKMTSKSSRGELEITDSLNLLLKKKVQLASVKIDPRSWMDIGRPWDLLEANRRALEHAYLENKGELERGAYLRGAVGVGEGTKIRSGAYVEGPVFIGNGSDIGPNCHIRPYTSLGDCVRIGNACEVKNSIILNQAHIGHISYVGDSIIGEKCNFGAGTITANLRFDDRPISVNVKGKMVNSGVRKLGVIMGDNVKTGVGVRFMPGVKVGADAWIGPSTTIYEDSPSGTFVKHSRGLEFKVKS